MSSQTHESDSIELLVQLSEEIDAEEKSTPVSFSDADLERFLGHSLTTGSFSPTVETAADIIIACNTRLSVSARQAMLRGADRAMQAHKADTDAEQHGYTL